MRTNAKKVMLNLARKFSAALDEAPKELANEGKRFFMDNFRKQAWEGKRWPARNPKSKNRNPLLVGRTRRLKNAVNNSVKEANKTRIKWGVYLPYAAVHNEGYRGIQYVKPGTRKRFGKTKVTDITRMSIKTRSYGTRSVRTQTGKVQVRGFSRKVNIPKRKFMGMGPTLRKRLGNKLGLIIKSKLK